MDFFESNVVRKLHFSRTTPWKINGWNIQITHLERKMIFQTSMIMFHVNLQGCNMQLIFGTPLREEEIDFLKQVFWQAPMLSPFSSGGVWSQEMFNIHSTLRDERVQQSGYEVGNSSESFDSPN